MTVSRWKVMAGVLGASLGGLAALAGQAPKVADTHQAEPPMADKIKPAGPAAPPIDVPPPFPTPTTTKPTVPVLPNLNEPPIAAAKSAPALPVPKPEVVPASGLSLPSAPVIPAAGSTQVPPIPSGPMGTEPVPMPPKSVPSAPPAPTGGVLPEIKIEPPKPSEPAVAPLGAFSATTTAPSAPPATGATIEPAGRVAPATAAVTAAVTKYRILLRVGEGEPQFEVRNGDDLMMKVVCEKVDIASPAVKGPATQQVKASGKVRFAGFGSEGTCDELSFIAGTGELMLAGNVTIQVKDKLGRVDSELKSDKVKYKLDASAIPGVMKP